MTPGAMPPRRPRRSGVASPPKAAPPRLCHLPADRFRKGRRRINRCCGPWKLLERRRQSHRRKPGQLAGAELPAPGKKLAAADPVQPAHQRGRRSWRHALRQYPKLLFEAPASPALRTSENLAANLASPRMSTPEGLIIDQRPLHRRRKGRQASNSPRQAQDNLQLTLTEVWPTTREQRCCVRPRTSVSMR